MHHHDMTLVHMNRVLGGWLLFRHLFIMCGAGAESCSLFYPILASWGWWILPLADHLCINCVENNWIKFMIHFPIPSDKSPTHALVPRCPGWNPGYPWILIYLLLAAKQLWYCDNYVYFPNHWNLPASEVLSWTYLQIFSRWSGGCTGTDVKRLLLVNPLFSYYWLFLLITDISHDPFKICDTFFQFMVWCEGFISDKSTKVMNMFMITGCDDSGLL